MDIGRASRREELPIDLEPAATPSRPPTSAVRRELLDVDPSRYASSHDPPELLAFYAGLRAQATGAAVLDATPTTRDDAARAAIDGTRAAYSGPYTVEGQRVTATPMFRLTGGYPSQTKIGELPRIVGQPLASAMAYGQASPAQVVAATQKLIDAGKLPPPPGDVAARIRQMQWQYGVGLDCASFTRRALHAVTGKNDVQLGIQRTAEEKAAGKKDDLGMRGLDGNPHFVKVKLANVRPGDVITLDPKPGETVGHNVIVRDRTVASDAQKQELARVHGPIAQAFLASAGPHEVLQVDSSWGAGANGAAYGGYRRDTWVHDASNGSWGYFEAATGSFRTSVDGPSTFDRFHGAYRARP
ncbi:hypothetical protein BH11MYX4_BH11MYX4_09070 [soil metagenome]